MKKLICMFLGIAGLYIMITSGMAQEKPKEEKPPPPGKPFVTEVKTGQPKGPITVTPRPDPPPPDQPTRPQKEIKPD